MSAPPSGLAVAIALVAGILLPDALDADDLLAFRRIEDDDALRARIPPRGPRGRPKSTEVAVCTRRDVEAFMRRWNLDVGDMADWLKASPGSVRHWCYDTRPVPNKHGEKIVNFTGDVVDFPVYQTKLLENKTTGREGSLRYFGMDWHTNKLRSILVDDIEVRFE